MGFLVKSVGQDERRLFDAFTQVRKRKVRGIIAQMAIPAEFSFARRFHDFLKLHCLLNNQSSPISNDMIKKRTPKKANRAVFP
jgi:hypothetical protein